MGDPDENPLAGQRTRRRNFLVVIGMVLGNRLASLGAALAAALALKSAGWSFLPIAPVVLAVLLGTNRALWRVILLWARHLDSRS